MREVGSRIVCDQCSAVQLDCDDLADAVGLRALTFRDGKPTTLACPRCQRMMTECRITVDRTELHDVVARCERDGLWLGAGQLDVVLEDAIKVAREPGHRDRSVPNVMGTGPTGERGAGRRAPYVVQKWWEKPRPRVVVPYRSALVGKSLVCPGCSLELQAKSDHWSCDACGGLFVETPALEAMVTEMTRTPYTLAVPAGVEGERACPVCSGKTLVSTLDGIEIDRCPAHGIWFDSGELAALLAQAGGVELPGEAGKAAGKPSWLRGLFRGHAKPS